MRGDQLRDLMRRPWRDVVLPPAAVGIPTMLSKAERKVLYSLARDYAGGDHAIVDAGCFLGGSTAAYSPVSATARSRGVGRRSRATTCSASRRSRFRSS